MAFLGGGVAITSAICGYTAQPRHVVGGFAQHTAIREDGMTVRMLERWTDKIGERIAPDQILQ